jgi:hypothetical protein
MSRTSETLVVLPTCRGYFIPMQSIEVDWCIVHDRQEWPVEVEDDDNLRPNMAPPEVGPDGRSAGVRAGYVTHIVAPRPEIYGERTSAIRQAGLDYGYREGYQYVLTVDDDCELPLGWAEDHVKALGGLVPVCNNTVPGQVIRGLPTDYTRPVGISHGLWSGVLDYPAWFQLANNPGPVTIEDRGWKPIRSPFPMCGMNVGFRRDVLPAVFFQHTFRRHDDIFAGWIAQAVLDLHGYGYVNGGAVVRHERASNAEENLKKEAPGDAVNRALCSHVRGFQSTYGDVAGTFGKLAAHVGRLRVGDPESDRLIQQYAASMQTWQRRLK